jgi:Mn-dependent DtxR family transcriptional regulator
VTHESGDELGRQVTQAVGVLADEGVLLVSPQREVRVHSRSLHVGERLGHKARRQARLAREFFYDVAQ